MPLLMILRRDVQSKPLTMIVNDEQSSGSIVYLPPLSKRVTIMVEDENEHKIDVISSVDFARHC